MGRYHCHQSHRPSEDKSGAKRVHASCKDRMQFSTTPLPLATDARVADVDSRLKRAASSARQTLSRPDASIRSSAISPSRAEAFLVAMHASLPHKPFAKKAGAPAAIVGTRTFRSRNRLKVSHEVSDARMHAWHAAAFM